MTNIYESPDHGQTVYQRPAGTLDRKLIKDSRTSDGRPLFDHIQEDKMWGEIRRMAKTHPGLQAELERVIVLYNLIKDHGW